MCGGDPGEEVFLHDGEVLDALEDGPLFRGWGARREVFADAGEGGGEGGAAGLKIGEELGFFGCVHIGAMIDGTEVSAGVSEGVSGATANRRSFDCAVLTPGFAQDDNIVGGQTARDAVGATIAAIV